MGQYAINKKTVSEAISGGGVLVVAQWEAKDGQADKVADILRRFLPEAQSDPGAKLFLISRGRENPAQFLFYELFRDEAALKAHQESAYFKTFIAGEALLVALESRLDNLVYRMGFATSRKQARQLVRHRHILVNGRKVDIPSYRVLIGDEVKVADASRELVQVKLALEQFGRGQPVSWIQVDTDKVLGKVTERPTRDAIPLAAQEQLIVELYSK